MDKRELQKLMDIISSIENVDLFMKNTFINLECINTILNSMRMSYPNIYKDFETSHNNIRDLYQKFYDAYLKYNSSSFIFKESITNENVKELLANIRKPRERNVKE